MKGKAIDKLVFEYMFPHHLQNDPRDFQDFLARHLIPEVRQETQAYYGHIETSEARYPGLDYCHAIHRIRLSRWPWHRRLFRAFNALKLTDCEVSRLTKWEGTKWAKERHEREHGVTIRDSALDETPFFIDRRNRSYQRSPALETVAGLSGQLDETNGTEDGEGEDGDGDDENDDAMESVGPTLNERLREQVARREAGDTTAVLDEEWEQWLKNALETGGFPDVAEAISQGEWVDSESLVPTLSVFPPSMLRAARAGRWEDVPESLEPTLRRAVEAESLHIAATTADASDVFWRAVDDAGQGGFRQYYSELRLPGGSGSLRRTAQAPWG